ncbi:hypothetical protein pb186bvf_000617 [Paramecium bursaria]
MGQPQQKAQPPPKDPMDIILDIRMSKKRLQSDARKCEKEKEQNMQKAKAALLKNNEEGAKLFLQTAMSKQNEATNLQKMANKLEMVEQQVKSQQNNLQMVNQLSRITPIMAQYSQNMSTEQIYNNMDQFNNVMDDIMVQGNVVNNMLNKNSDYQTNMQVDMALQQMKNEEAVKLQNLQPVELQFQNLQQQQQQQIPNYQQKQFQQ